MVEAAWCARLQGGLFHDWYERDSASFDVLEAGDMVEGCSIGFRFASCLRQARCQNQTHKIDKKRTPALSILCGACTK